MNQENRKSATAPALSSPSLAHLRETPSSETPSSETPSSETHRATEDRIIVIEGIDGIGKSTLVNSLERRLANSSVFKFEPFPGQNNAPGSDREAWMDYTHLTLQNGLKAALGASQGASGAISSGTTKEGAVILLDRGPVSNLVVTNLKHHVNRFFSPFSQASQLRAALSSRSYLSKSEEALSKHGVVVLLQPAWGDVSWILQRNLKRPDEPEYSTDHTSLFELNRLYDAWRKITTVPVVTVFVERDQTPEEVTQKVLGRLRREGYAISLECKTAKAKPKISPRTSQLQESETQAKQKT